VLRTNLATRPFYNERAVHVVIGAVAAVVLAITIFNVVRIVTLSQHNTELSARINAERAEAERLTSEAARIRRTINKDELTLVVNEAEEANALIDQRTFSWTEFFNLIESTLPPDVMLSAVRPSFKDGVTRVNMFVLGRRPEDVDEFMEKLEATGSFEEINAAASDWTDAGLKRAVIESVYEAHPAEEAATPAPTEPKPAPAPPQGRGGRQ
jgi:cell division protein FtsB